MPAHTVGGPDIHEYKHTNCPTGIHTYTLPYIYIHIHTYSLICMQSDEMRNTTPYQRVAPLFALCWFIVTAPQYGRATSRGVCGERHTRCGRQVRERPRVTLFRPHTQVCRLRNGGHCAETRRRHITRVAHTLAHLAVYRSGNIMGC